AGFRARWSPNLRRPSLPSLPNPRWRVDRFRNLGQPRGMDLGAQSKELAEAHDQRAPFGGIDAVFVAFHHDLFGDVDTFDADFDGDQGGRLFGIAVAD